MFADVTNVPLAQPGFDALSMSAPILVQINPDGKWENNKPGDLDEERLKAIVQYLVSSNTVSAAQSYCRQCALESQNDGDRQLNYVPIIMMPIYPADQCLFDIECDVKNNKKADSKELSTKNAKSDHEKEDKKNLKKRGFTIQRLTDFDLLSQW